jgi:chaperonin GroES
MITIQPLYDRVVLKRPTPIEETTRGGIIIPQSVVGKEKPLIGEVVAVGPGKYNANMELVPTHVKVGDKVLVGKIAGIDIELEGEKYNIVQESEIVGIVITEPST